MTDNNNIVPFRPRVALTTCTLPQENDGAIEGQDELGPIESRPYSIDVIGGAGGKSLLDACLPTHVAMAAMAFIMERLNAPAIA
jgi:hypothetical protein